MFRFSNRKCRKIEGPNPPQKELIQISCMAAFLFGQGTHFSGSVFCCCTRKGFGRTTNHLHGVRRPRSFPISHTFRQWTFLCPKHEVLPEIATHRTTSTRSQRKGRAPQPSITPGGSALWGGGVLHNNNDNDDTYIHDSIWPIRLTVALGLKMLGSILSRLASPTGGVNPGFFFLNLTRRSD